MGFALGETDSVYGGTLPVLPGDSSLAELLGRWRGFLEQVISLRETLSGSYSLSRWITICHQILDRFFAPDEAEMDNVVRLRQRLARLASDGAIAQFVGPLSLLVLRDAVERRIGDAVGGRSIRACDGWRPAFAGKAAAAAAAAAPERPFQAA